MTIKKSAAYSKSFKQGIASLADELFMAAQWSRPSLLVAIHARRAEQAKARGEIKKQMEQNQISVTEIEAGKDLSVVMELIHSPEKEREVVFLSNILNDDIYRALNLHRETFVEKKSMLVLWLLKSESVSLARLAPDFWAFRHRVVEFAPGHARKKP